MTGEDLKEWRTRHELTQTELAAALGVQKNTVWRWELGESGIAPFMPLALAELERVLNGQKSRRRRKRA
jgi:transcriptional regulator with XRE-family HTH domain